MFKMKFKKKAHLQQLICCRNMIFSIKQAEEPGDQNFWVQKRSTKEETGRWIKSQNAGESEMIYPAGWQNCHKKIIFININKSCNFKILFGTRTKNHNLFKNT